MRDILGRERLRKSLEARRIKMNTKHRAVAPKPEPLLHKMISLEKQAEEVEKTFSALVCRMQRRKEAIQEKRNVVWTDTSRAKG